MGGLAKPRAQQPPYEKLRPIEKAILTGVKEVRRRKGLTPSAPPATPGVVSEAGGTTMRRARRRRGYAGTIKTGALRPITHKKTTLG